MFSIKQGNAAKEEILGAAHNQLKLIEVKRANDAAAALRRQRDLEKAAKEKAAGTATVFEREDNTGEGWGRGSKIEETKKMVAD